MLLCTLGGCASAPRSAPEPERLSLDASQCVTSLSALAPHLLVADAEGTQRAHGRFADLTGCVMDHETPRPVALFSLAGQAPPFQVRVQLEGSSTGTLAAELALLDASFQLVRRHAFSEFVRRGLDRTLATFVNPQDGAVRYLLVRPDAAHVGTVDRVIFGQRWATVWITPVAIGSYADGIERISDVPLTDAGSLSIEVTPYGTTATRD